jgi:hypothetical protein
MTKRLTCLCFILFLTCCLPNTPIVTPQSTSLPLSTVTRLPTVLLLPSSTSSTASPPSLTPTSTQKLTPTNRPTNTVAPTKTAIVESCSGAPEVLLKVGDWARVSVDPPLPNKIRNHPGTSGEVIGWVQPGENVLVVDGPRCNDGYTWWLVRNLSGLEGWTVEGDTSSYWLVEPIYAWYQLPNPLQSQGAKTYDLRELKIYADLALVYNMTGSYIPLATPMPRPLTQDTPEPNDPRYSDFGFASYAAHSFYTISGAIGDSFWVYDITDPLSRYYLNHQSYNDCTQVLRDNLDSDVIIKASLDPFCGMNQGIPILFKAGIKRIQFTGGEGVRYMIASGNYLTANTLTYHFQGLSDDGRYYITILIRPILHPYIIEDQLFYSDFGWILAWKDGQYEQAEKTYNSFNARIEELLNADQVKLYPSLEFLDEMMASIVIK